MDRKDTIESIIVKYLSGSASDEESGLLLQWLKESKGNRKTYFSLKRIWLKTQESDDNHEFIGNSWNRLKLRTILQTGVSNKGGEGIRFNPRKLSIAASILILIGISMFLGIKIKSLSDYQLTVHEITVPMGSRSNIMLPDGTSVWLNADSKLSYRSDFGRRNRDVTLSGEAYFDVHQQGSSIFSVNTRDVNIKVLGTQFNVKSYPDEEVTETTIVSGRVEVAVNEAGNATRPVLLTQNQRIIYSRAEGRLITRPVETVDKEIVVENTVEELVQKPSLQITKISSIENYTSWKDGKLVFNSETLENLARKLERFYNIEIFFLDDSIKDICYSGTLVDVTIEDVLRAIASSSKINYNIDKNKVIFSN